MRILHLTTLVQRSALSAIAHLARLQQADGHHATVADVLRFSSADAAPGDRFDIIHLHATAPGLIPARLHAASPVDAPVVLTMHGYAGRKSREQQQVDATVLNRFSRVVVASRTVHEGLIHAGVNIDQLRLVPYGVDPVIDPFAGLDSSDADLAAVRRFRRDGGRVVGCVGERRSLPLIMEALSLMPAAVRPLCVLVSDGDLGGASALAECFGVGASVRGFGYKANQREFARACDWLLLPSASAGPSLPAIEAFCDRVPVLAADTAEMVELIHENHAGRLFRAGDSEALASALAAALAMPDDERHALCGRAHSLYRARFRTGAMVDRHMAEYEELVAQWAQDALLRPAA